VLYTASYFEPQRHYGKLISISRSIPKNFRVHSRLEFFIPSADLLRDWKAKRIGEEEYTNRYREQIRANLKVKLTGSKAIVYHLLQVFFEDVN
jgi:hypothetical protein